MRVGTRERVKGRAACSRTQHIPSRLTTGTHRKQLEQTMADSQSDQQKFKDDEAHAAPDVGRVLLKAVGFDEDLRARRGE